MRIESVEFFYASMPSVNLDVDGSQDALLVRVTDNSGAHGWGECEASPLTSIAAFVAPRSHGVCQPVADSVRGERLDRPEDIPRIAARVARNSADLLQAPHTFSGIEIALWDLLGRRLSEPVWRLLGYETAHKKTAYASMLFGDTPTETLALVAGAVSQGFRAVKLGWGRFGAGAVQDDIDHLIAAREALGPERLLLVDAGQVWGDDVEAAMARIPAMTQTGVAWIEEPFHPQNFTAHAALAAASASGPTRLAGGESAHSVRMATNLIDYGRIGYVQIDTGRVGGIHAAHQVALHADRAGTQYVNHTFTSHLALSASLQPFAGLAAHRLCEYPVQPSLLALAIAGESIIPDGNGEISVPSAPGLGVEVDLDSVLPYLREVRIAVDGAVIYASPRPTPASLVADRSV